MHSHKQRLSQMPRRTFLRTLSGGAVLIAAGLFGEGCGGGGSNLGPAATRSYRVNFLFPVTSARGRQEDAGVNGGAAGRWFAIINNKGDVLALDETGTFGTPNFVAAFVYRSGARMDTGLRNVASFRYFTPPPRWFDMNDNGQVLVTKYANPPADFNTQGVLWHDGVQTDLGALLPGESVFATNVNNQGQALAHQFQGQNNQTSWLWQNGAITSLGNIIAEDINNRGQVAGTAYQADHWPEGLRPVLWEQGRLQELPTSGDVVKRQSIRLNDSGVVIANFESGRPGKWQDDRFAYLEGNGWAYDLNSAGTIVGFAAANAADPSGSSSARAVLWEEGAQKDLNTLIPTGSGWLLEQAVDINDAGWIVGVGTFNGQSAAFLLTPQS